MDLLPWLQRSERRPSYRVDGCGIRSIGRYGEVEVYGYREGGMGGRGRGMGGS